MDSEKLANWQTTNASLADFGGFPSSVIEGTYRENDMTLNTARRHVIATSGSDRYLVSLSITTAANQVVASAAATDAIAKGLPRRRPRRPCGTRREPGGPGSGGTPAAVAAAPATGRRAPRPRRWSRSRSGSAALTPDSYSGRMIIGGVVCLALAVLVGGSGLFAMRRAPGADVTSQVLRAMAPTPAGRRGHAGRRRRGRTGLPARVGLLVLIVCVVGAVGTVAAGSWQGARYAARREATTGCGGDGGCTGCTKVCQ